MYQLTRGEGFGAEVKRRIMLGTYVLSAGYYDAYYLKAQRVRTLIARDFAQAFEKVDALIAPVSPFPAFRLGEKLDDPLEMYLSDIYTITGSLAGIPCMSVPCGTTRDGLPVGMQILARHFDEPGRVGSIGTAALSRACSINTWTPGSSSVAGLFKIMWRAAVPVPCRSLSGSGRPAPCRKNKLTQRGYRAMEKIASEARSDGPKPIANAL